MEVFDLRSVTVSELLRWLEQGKVLALPTETAYGLVADSTNASAVCCIYRLKGRKVGKPLPLICSSLSQVRKFFYMPNMLSQLARRYWPGALSIQLKVKSKRSKVKNKKLEAVSCQIQVPTLDNTLVVRVSANELLRQLARQLGRPITATSANVSGRGELYVGKEVVKQFQGRRVKPDIIIADGKLPKRKPSTIIGIEQGEVVVLRQGEIHIK